MSRGTTGLQALAVMRQRAALRPADRNVRLSDADREKIASALAVEIQRLKETPSLWKRDFSTAALMRAAGLVEADANPTKRLNEYVRTAEQLLDDVVAKRRVKLSSSYAKFARLIDALLGFTIEDPDAVCTRLFRGTSLQGTHVDIVEHRRVAAALSVKVEKVNRLLSGIDKGETLGAIFTRTALQKRAIQRAGARVNWPFLPLDASHDPSRSEVPDWEHPFWPPDLERHTFRWQSGILGGAMYHLPFDWYDALLHLPRAYVGCAIHFEMWDVEPGKDVRKTSEYLAEIHRSHHEIAEWRALGMMETKMVWQQPAAGHYRTHPDPDEHGYLAGEGHCWLAIYPSPPQPGPAANVDKSDSTSRHAKGQAIGLNTQGLSAILYWCQGEAGVFLSVLDESNIHLLSHFYVSTGNAERPIATVYDRVTELLEDDNHALELEWARTSIDVLRNPVLRYRDVAAQCGQDVK